MDFFTIELKHKNFFVKDLIIEGVWEENGEVKSKVLKHLKFNPLVSDLDDEEYLKSPPFFPKGFEEIENFVKETIKKSFEDRKRYVIYFLNPSDELKTILERECKRWGVNYDFQLLEKRIQFAENWIDYSNYEKFDKQTILNELYTAFGGLKALQSVKEFLEKLPDPEKVKLFTLPQYTEEELKKVIDYFFKTKQTIATAFPLKTKEEIYQKVYAEKERQKKKRGKREKKEEGEKEGKKELKELYFADIPKEFEQGIEAQEDIKEVGLKEFRNLLVFYTILKGVKLTERSIFSVPSIQSKISKKALLFTLAFPEVWGFEYYLTREMVSIAVGEIARAGTYHENVVKYLLSQLDAERPEDKILEIYIKTLIGEYNEDKILKEIEELKRKLKKEDIPSAKFIAAYRQNLFGGYSVNGKIVISEDNHIRFIAINIGSFFFPDMESNSSYTIRLKALEKTLFEMAMDENYVPKGENVFASVLSDLKDRFSNTEEEGLLEDFIEAYKYLLRRPVKWGHIFNL
jgi:hypothetical protein